MRFARFLCVRSLAVAAAGIVVVAFAASAQTVQAAGSCAVGDPSVDAEEQAFVSLLNDYRAANGQSRLTVSANLTRAAEWMANDLAGRNEFAHQDSLGRGSQQRITDCGYAGPAGENLAAGTSWDSASSAFAAWKGSPGHNANMLYATYVQVGVARIYAPGSKYGWYWVTTFGTVDDGGRLAASTGGRSQASVDAPATVTPLWVNDLSYGNRGGGFYWDPASGGTWTGELGWHRYRGKAGEPLWVNDLAYPSIGQGFYLDIRTNQAWTAECGWHRFSRAGCR